MNSLKVKPMPKIVDHDERRTHIANSVTNVILRDGIEGATMREIAAEAGYAHGAIARYFPNKQSLIAAAYLHVFEESQRRVIKSAQHVRGLKALEIMSRQILPFSNTGAKKAKVVVAFWALASQDPELEELHRVKIHERREVIRRFLTEAKEDGELAPHVDVETAVDEVSARNAGWQMLASLVPETLTDDRVEKSMQALFESLRSHKQSHG